MPDPVQGIQAVAHPHRVQATPLARGEHPRVDLQVQMPVRIPSPRRVVPHRDSLQQLDRHLNLTSPRTHPRRRVLGQPADDLGRRAIHRRVVRRRDIGVQRGRQRPRLRPVDHDLDEPDRARVLPQPPPRRSSERVATRNPGLVGIAIQGAEILDTAVGSSDEPLREARSLGQVVVVHPGMVGLDIVARSRRHTAVDLDPTLHVQHQPTLRPETPFGPPVKGGPTYVNS
jgi:hypothetical protein